MRKQFFVLALTLVAGLDMFFVFAPFSITFQLLSVGIPFLVSALIGATIYGLIFYSLARRFKWI